ncbi:glycosyltransferase family 9 protein [Pseudomarimonas salicorniae]|uniref:glycosyltransferase family 9 protein n=1 Tax=Pseudomarimonas salicorniae TaxID=2933270 RepID=UPI003CCDFBAA
MPSTSIESICLLRLSALGDVTHVVPLVRTLQARYPEARLAWVIGKLEHKLVGDLPGVEFVVVDKSRRLSDAKALRETLQGRRFDVLLQMQVALRANLLSTLVPAERRVGYDRARAKDLHGLVINQRIEPGRGQHVLDAIASFGTAIGAPRLEAPVWDIPISEADHAFAESVLPGDQPTLLLSPCSSHALRNWHTKGYAALAGHAAERGYRILLCGGRSALERNVGDAIIAATRAPVIDLIGKDTLKQLLALMQRASIVATPDSGPMHMANAVGTRVLGLHAASNPHRSGPYSDRRFCVDRYPEAARKFLRRDAERLPWGKKIEFPGVMDLIDETDVIEAFERHLATPA